MGGGGCREEGKWRAKKREHSNPETCPEFERLEEGEIQEEVRAGSVGRVLGEAGRKGPHGRKHADPVLRHTSPWTMCACVCENKWETDVIGVMEIQSRPG